VEPNKILLFYRFTPLNDPEAIRLWQKTLCESLELKGRIIISAHGINGTVGGPLSAVKKYVRATKEWTGFRDIDFKWSEGTGLDFPRLQVRVRDELVSFGAPEDLQVDQSGVVQGGRHLTPAQVHDLVAMRGEDVTFFDGRNAFEAEIGRFKNAVVPNVETTHDFVKVLESGTYDHLKDKPIVTYCTGGVRCEVLSSLMLQRGFQEVYQIEGGIARYGEAYGNEGLWEGSLFVFDGRMNQEFGPNTKLISTCERCTTPTNQYYNCANLACRQLILLCDTCITMNGSTNCQEQHHGARYRSKL
jgi:UPF0176 protein